MAQSWKDKTKQKNFDLSKVGSRFRAEDFSSYCESEDTLRSSLDDLGKELAKINDQRKGVGD